MKDDLERTLAWLQFRAFLGTVKMEPHQQKFLDFLWPHGTVPNGPEIQKLRRQLRFAVQHLTWATEKLRRGRACPAWLAMATARATAWLSTEESVQS